MVKSLNPHKGKYKGLSLRAGHKRISSGMAWCGGLSLEKRTASPVSQSAQRP